MIETKEQAINAASQASLLIQQISDYLGKNPHDKWHARVRFPRGFIGTAADKRQKLPFIEDETLKRNVSYALMTHDVLRWIAFNTDLGGQAREMIIKEAVCLLGSICESISIFPHEHGLGRGSGYKRRIARLVEMKVIGPGLQRRLDWLWDKRNQEHLYDVPFREFDHYVNSDWYRSVKAYHMFRDALTIWRCPNKLT
jgi:hypothetical protein